jgi:hypothetical protein
MHKNNQHSVEFSAGARRRGFVAQAAQLVLLGLGLASMGMTAALGAGDETRADRLPCNGILCVPTVLCSSAGCCSGLHMFHCTGCGDDYHKCYSNSCSNSFCLNVC